MKKESLAKLIGINHVSIEVGNIQEAVDFYSSIFKIEVEYEEDLGISKDEMASFELGDQFIAITKKNNTEKVEDTDRHIGFVVDNKDAVRQRLKDLDIKLLNRDTLTFLDPWGNRIEIVSYQNIMFSKLDGILNKMGLEDIEKNNDAILRMRKKGYIH